MTRQRRWRPFGPRRRLVATHIVRTIADDASCDDTDGAPTRRHEWTPIRIAPLTVIVPVFDAFDDVRRCLDSIVEHTMHPDVELLVIDDASPDPRIATLLASFENDHEGIEVLRNRENLGFLQTMNRGFDHAVGRDVVMLNSDTIVTPRWLIGLCEAANDPTIGTVTALSNNAWAFSAPTIGHNDLPATVEESGRAVRQRSERRYPRTPSGHGFCMLVKRQVLDEVGGFDEVFGRGYCEENDLSMRASMTGWRHVVDDATLVAHAGSVSFADEKPDLLVANRKLLDERHPTYTQLIQAFVASDEMAKVRERVADTFDHVRASPPMPRVLFVAGPMGTPPHVDDLIRATSHRYESLVLRCSGRMLTLTDAATGEALETTRLPRERSSVADPLHRRAVARLVSAYTVELIHIIDVEGLMLDLESVAAETFVPMIVSAPGDDGSGERWAERYDEVRADRCSFVRR